jgi:parallel beta-helix repeat protein
VRLGLVAALLGSGAQSAWSVTLRWANTSNRIYVTGPGSTTLGGIKAALPNAPLTETAPGVWHLGANVLLEQGAELVLHGTGIGGDVNQLRLKSNNSTSANGIVWISADWGSIDIRSTSITSWDDAANGPDTQYGTYGRAYIRVRSSLDANGVTPHESRMDIVDSDIGYLGYNAAESYGLTWKVIGSQNNLFDKVNVYGDVQNSRIHHNYFGVYTYGAYGMNIQNNEVDNNIKYGLDPHDDSDSLVIEGNHSHHNGNHGIIASQRCNNLLIRNNISEFNTGNGIMLHRLCNDSLVEDNECYDNTDSGIAIFDTDGVIIQNNLVQGNGNAGIRLSVGSANNLIQNNEIWACAKYGFYLYKGTDAPRPGDDGRPENNVFIGNLVHDNGQEGIKISDGDNNRFEGNQFASNGSVLRFDRGIGNELDGNVIPSNVTVKTSGNSGFSAETIIRNQPSVRVQLDSYSTVTFEDENGAVFAPEEQGIATTLTPAGSALSLTTADIGTSSTVLTRALQVLPNGGNALVAVTVWGPVNSTSQQWIVEAGSASQSLAHTVGDLIPNNTYRVLKNGQQITQVTADGAGRAGFVDVPGTIALVEYKINLVP